MNVVAIVFKGTALFTDPKLLPPLFMTMDYAIKKWHKEGCPPSNQEM